MVAEKSSIASKTTILPRDNQTHLSIATRLARIRESTQHPNTWKAHAEHSITECTCTVRAIPICLSMLPSLLLLLLLGEPSSCVGAHLSAHLHGLTIDGCIDAERGGRIQRIGRECGGRTRLEGLGDRCLRTISVVGECVTIRRVCTRIGSGGGGAIE